MVQVAEENAKQAQCTQAFSESEPRTFGKKASVQKILSASTSEFRLSFGESSLFIKKKKKKNPN